MIYVLYKPHKKAFQFCVLMTLLLSYKMQAQTIFYNDKNELNNKTYPNPFADYMLNPATLKDGSYQIYEGTNYKLPLFKGEISKGALTGVYHFYRKGYLGAVDTLRSDILEVTNNHWNGNLPLGFRFGDFNFDKFIFHFKDNALVGLRWIDPMFKLRMPDFKITKKGIDTVHINFNQGALELMAFREIKQGKTMLWYNINEKDTQGIKKLKLENEQLLYTPQDTIHVAFVRTITQADTVVHGLCEIELLYDSLQHIRVISMKSSLENREDEVPLTLMRIYFNELGLLSTMFIEQHTDIVAAVQNNIIDTGKKFDTEKWLLFKNNGELNIEKWGKQTQHKR